MVELFANSGDPDQMPQNVASDLGLHCLPITLLRVSRLQWVNNQYFMFGREKKKLIRSHQRAIKENIDQTAWMHRLVWSYAVRICQKGLFSPGVAHLIEAEKTTN